LPALFLAAVMLADCHKAPLNPWVPVPSARFAGRAFGDTMTMRTSIVALDTVREVVVFRLAAPAHLVMLEVTPGVSIEQLQPIVGSKTLQQSAGEHMVTTMDSSLAAEESELLRREVYERCTDEAELRAGRRPIARPPVRRDSTGKVSPESAGEQLRAEAAEARVREADLEACKRTAARLPATPTRKTARRGEHYLVILASQSPLSGVEVAERLRTLSVVGSDVATTIEAIGAGIFVGRPGTWSGYYVSR
jgi:hypothetical protein